MPADGFDRGKSHITTPWVKTAIAANMVPHSRSEGTDRPTMLDKNVLRLWPPLPIEKFIDRPPSNQRAIGLSIVLAQLAAPPKRATCRMTSPPLAEQTIGALEYLSALRAVYNVRGMFRYAGVSSGSTPTRRALNGVVFPSRGRNRYISPLDTETLPFAYGP